MDQLENNFISPSISSLGIFQLHSRTINKKQQIENFWKSSSILKYFVKSFNFIFWKMYLLLDHILKP